MRRSIVIATLLAGVLTAGCSEDSSSPLSPGSAALVSVSPSNGAGGVRLDAAVTLTFSAPVSKELVQRELHLISEWAISDSACPDSATMWHPDMEHCMGDSAIMRHLDRYHAAPGGFSWNAAGTQCTFRPAASMTSATEYMIHIGPDVTSMATGSMGGMMDGHGPGMMSRDLMLHFTTMDAGSGHNGYPRALNPRTPGPN